MWHSSIARVVLEFDTVSKKSQHNGETVLCLKAEEYWKIGRFPQSLMMVTRVGKKLHWILLKFV